LGNKFDRELYELFGILTGNECIFVYAVGLITKIPISEYILKRITLATLFHCGYKLGRVEILIVTQKKICLIYIAKAADKHSGFATVIFDLCCRQGVADVIICHKKPPNKTYLHKKFHYIL
jgi:hypothetical protein